MNTILGQRRSGLLACVGLAAWIATATAAPNAARTDTVTALDRIGPYQVPSHEAIWKAYGSALEWVEKQIKHDPRGWRDGKEWLHAAVLSSREEVDTLLERLAVEDRGGDESLKAYIKANGGPGTGPLRLLMVRNGTEPADFVKRLLLGSVLARKKYEDIDNARLRKRDSTFHEVENEKGSRFTAADPDTLIHGLPVLFGILDRLSPSEVAVFVTRATTGAGFSQIADALDATSEKAATKTWERVRPKLKVLEPSDLAAALKVLRYDTLPLHRRLEQNGDALATAGDAAKAIANYKRAYALEPSPLLLAKLGTVEATTSHRFSSLEHLVSSIEQGGASSQNEEGAHSANAVFATMDNVLHALLDEAIQSERAQFWGFLANSPDHTLALLQRALALRRSTAGEILAGLAARSLGLWPEATGHFDHALVGNTFRTKPQLKEALEGLVIESSRRAGLPLPSYLAAKVSPTRQGEGSATDSESEPVDLVGRGEDGQEHDNPIKRILERERIREKERLR
jgi:tetratricopeptide (TPR) repeat protein